jgi:hypothetical protein
MKGAVHDEEAVEFVVRVRPARARPVHASDGAADKCVRSNLPQTISKLCTPLTESRGPAFPVQPAYGHP